MPAAATGHRLGIDLGTAFTAAAFVEGTKPRMLELGRRRVSAPSVVFVAEDGTLLIGDAAERRAVAQPDRVLREFKRRFGDEVPMVVGDRTFSAVELQTQMLRWVLDHAEQRLSSVREHTVVTYPANWGPYKLQCLHQMLAATGIAGATLCPEPIAAAIDFNATREVPGGAKLVIYDLGGGTFDVAVVEKTGTGFELLGAASGLDHLGGSDFDEAVFRFILQQLDVHDLDQDDPDIARGLIALRSECVEAKETLSVDVNTDVSCLLPGAVRTVRFSRREFEEMIRPGLDESIAVTSRALRLAGTAPSELHAVVLVGGSSRIPLVTELLTREFQVPVVLDTYPKNTIARGAARLALTADAPAALTSTPTSTSAPTSASTPPPVAASTPTSASTPPPVASPVAPQDRVATSPATSSASSTSSAPVRPRWLLPAIAAAAVALVVTGIVVFTRQPEIVAGPANGGVTSAASPATAEPSDTSSATPPAAVRSLPSGPPIPPSVVMVPIRTSAGGQRQIHLIDTTGDSRRVVLTSKQKMTNPTVHHDRTTILLRRDTTVWVMSSDGRGGRPLTHRQAAGCSEVVGVSWSPTDPNVMVVACRLHNAAGHSLLVSDLDGTLIRRLPTGNLRTGDDVTISPDGNQVLYWASTKPGDGGALHTIAIDGHGKPRRLTSGTKARDGDPAWSPDGRQIAFSRRPGTGATDSDVYVMNADGTNQRKLADNGAADMKPTWSPDGQQLLIVSNRRSAHGPAGAKWRLWLLRVSDGAVLRHLGGSAAEITTPTWSHR